MESKFDFAKIFSFLVFLLPVIFCISCQQKPLAPTEPPAAVVAPPSISNLGRISRPILDFTIESRVEDLLRLNEEAFGGIVVKSRKGIIELTGTASPYWQTSRLIDAISLVPGVRKIINHVEAKAAPAPLVESPAPEGNFRWNPYLIAGFLLATALLVWFLRHRKHSPKATVAHS